MNIRSIMIFPNLENMEIINNFRNQYDPLAKLVRPHITLVFPFKSTMSNDEISEILDNRLKSLKPFELKLGGISKHEGDFGNYIFLNVLKGTDELFSIHKKLYENEFKEYDLGLSFTPHITLGKLPTVKLLNTVYNDIKFMDSSFRTTVNKISVEMIGDDEDSTIVFEKELY